MWFFAIVRYWQLSLLPLHRNSLEKTQAQQSKDQRHGGDAWKSDEIGFHINFWRLVPSHSWIIEMAVASTIAAASLDSHTQQTHTPTPVHGSELQTYLFWCARSSGGLMLAVVIICTLSFSHFIIAHTHTHSSYSREAAATQTAAILRVLCLLPARPPLSSSLM